jgi:hypothetical protein
LTPKVAPAPAAFREDRPLKIALAERARVAWPVLALLGVGFLLLSPALRTDYYAEDIPHSLTRGFDLELQKSYWGGLKVHLDVNLQKGRFYPITQVLHTSVHYLTADPFAYKAVLLAGTLFALFMYYLLVLRLTRSRAFASLAGIATLCLVQFRFTPDAVLGYYLQVQVVSAGLFASLLALQVYLEEGRTRWLVGSAAAYLLIALTYEITYLFFPMHLVLILRSRPTWRGRMAASLPILGVVLACGLATVAVRRFHSGEHYVHAIDNNTWSILKAVIHQVSAVLPLSYALGDYHELFHAADRRFLWMGWLTRPWSLMAALAVGALLLLVSRRRRVLDEGALGLSRWCREALLLGGLLVALPTPLIATSPFHRSQFGFGVGWVPVLLQVHGAGLILATAIWWGLGARWGGGAFARAKWVGAAVLLGLVAGTTYRANLIVARSLHAAPGSPDFRSQAMVHRGIWRNHRRNIEQAVRAGLLEGLPEGAALVLDHDYPLWHDAESSAMFYAQVSGRRFVTAPPSALAAGWPASGMITDYLRTHADRVYRLRDVCLGPDSGFVVLSPVEATASGRIGPRLFVRDPRLAHGPRAAGFVLEQEGTGARAPLALSTLSVRREGDEWVLCDLPNPSGPIEPGSLQVSCDPPRARRIAAGTRVGVQR